MATEVMLGRVVGRNSPAKLSQRRAKVKHVLEEFSAGELHSSSGQKVTSKDQALAIALSEAGLSRRKRKGR